MNKKKTETADDIATKISDYSGILSRLLYVISDDFSERESYMNYLNGTGFQGYIPIPKEKQKIIAMVLLGHYSSELGKLIKGLL